MSSPPRHANEQADVALDDVVLLPPIPDAAHIIGVGLNTRSHVGERERPAGAVSEEHPRLFLRTSDSLVGHHGEVWKPKVSDQFDYEGEIAVVIGRRGRHIDPADAVAYIAGYSCFDDGSVRDYQRHTTQNTPGKNFANSGGFGPWLTTADEAPPWHQLGATTTVNGERRQTLHPGDHIFGFDELISYTSRIWYAAARRCHRHRVAGKGGVGDRPVAASGRHHRGHRHLPSAR